MHLAVADPLLAPRELGELRVDLRLLLEHALLDLHDLRRGGPAPRPRSRSGADGLLAGLDLRLAAERLGLALGVGEEPVALRPRPCARASATTRAEHRGAASAPTRIPMSAATTVSMQPPWRSRLPAASAAVAHTRHSACRPSEPSRAVQLRRCRTLRLRPQAAVRVVVESWIEFTDSESLSVQEELRMKAESS